jgi:DNA-binding NarL/FixJ family response regulator
MNKLIKILIADDHAIVRQGLKQIVTDETGMEVTAEASNSAEVFSLLEKDEWDILILDINMPGISGLEALKQIKSNYPHLPVLILSMYSEDQYGIRAFQSGADGYLEKISAPEELVKAIRKIVNGGKYLRPSLAEKLAFSVDEHKGKSLHERLSNREYQILCAIASGKSAEDIAEELSISKATVYTYRKRILEKMNLKTNVQLTQYAIHNNLID